MAIRQRSASTSGSHAQSTSSNECTCTRNRPFSDGDDNNLALTHHSSGGHLFRTVSFIANPKRRLSRQSSLSWGHKPSPIIGASCFTFLLPIPFLLRVECYISAFFLTAVTITSFLSDHCYTGLESSWHTVDRIMAPMALTSNIFSVYMKCGLAWASLSIFAVLCHLIANHYSKKGMYNQFVIWHSLWHAVGSGLIVFCFVVHYDATTSQLV